MRQAAQPILPAFTPQAFISEQTGRAVKTHKGVHAELHRLTRDRPGFNAELRGFLSRT